MTTPLTPFSHVVTPGQVRLLDNLKNDYYCELRPSKIQGIGVFAFRDIPEGVNPFEICNRRSISEVILLREEDVEELPEKAKQSLKNYFIKTEDGYYPMHINGLNAINISFYMNHSNKPNMGADEEAVLGVTSNLFAPFKTLREIEEGEELCWDYRTDNDSVYDQYDFLTKDGTIKKWFKKVSKSP